MWEIVAGVASLVTMLGVLVAVAQLQVTKKQRTRQFEDMYVQ